MSAPKKQTVKFVRDYEVQDERAGTPDAEKYRKGQRAALSASSAKHFVARAAAVYIGKKPEA